MVTRESTGEVELTTGRVRDLMQKASDCPELEYLTAAQAAQRIGVSVEFIYDACAVGGLRHVRLGGKRNIRIKPEWQDEWMLQSVVVNG